jgi:glycosyltransferase involved in cell wall biosynthesis
MIEAMACGCPVIAYNRGAAQEVVDEGVSGFVVANESEAVAAASRLASLSRQAVRKQFERRFTARRMAENYLMLYRDLIEGSTQMVSAPTMADGERVSPLLAP